MWCINDRNIYKKINKHSKRCFTSLGSKASSEVSKGKFTKSLQLNLIRICHENFLTSIANPYPGSLSQVIIMPQLVQQRKNLPKKNLPFIVIFYTQLLNTIK